jgi:hypothetical protein
VDVGPGVKGLRISGLTKRRINRFVQCYYSVTRFVNARDKKENMWPVQRIKTHEYGACETAG